jgi:hypothetical protein
LNRYVGSNIFFNWVNHWLYPRGVLNKHGCATNDYNRSSIVVFCRWSMLKIMTDSHHFFRSISRVPVFGDF